MNTFNINHAKQWAKTSDSFLALLIKKLWFKIKTIEMPNIPVVFKLLYFIHLVLKQTISDVLRIIYYTPLLKSRLKNNPKQLYLYGGLPVVIGSLDIVMGDRVRLAAMTTISGRAVGQYIPQLIIGDNVGIAWRTSISVGKTIIIGNNVRIAGDCYLAGYPGHPVNAELRALGKPDEESQVGDIILEDDVWLATGVKVMPGVTIGRGTIVAAGSVVTKSLPSYVLAGGVPAKILKSIEDESHE
ncbi:acyltransferase [Colwellia psychrerythraea]|uniref:Transferase hexapeptide repeat containing protein n=1 Tax=Colwellia psychrerythraea TaxID=28229 RepID=A0A099KAB2_COLPS|nr:acyltransferase [Colwellia psychrerythraea]KGJ86543.1 transferase hexapeptide repeat containing protein [Colwellia psychrerythraea]